MNYTWMIAAACQPLLLTELSMVFVVLLLFTFELISWSSNYCDYIPYRYKAEMKDIMKQFMVNKLGFVTYSIYH